MGAVKVCCMHAEVDRNLNAWQKWEEIPSGLSKLKAPNKMLTTHTDTCQD